jgi:CBS domain-containing protein
MFVNSIMIPKNKSHYLVSDQKIGEALKILEELDLDSLPVINEDKYDGIVTRYRIYKYLFENDALPKEQILNSVEVSEIAAYKDVFLNGDEVFEKTLVVLKDFPAVAVVEDDGTFTGVVTRFDVLEQFRSVFGMNKPGVRIAFTSVEAEGRIAKLAEVTKNFHENIISITTFDETDKLVRRIVLKVEKAANIKQFIKKLENEGFRILSIYED